jgi:hypothetical protein
MEQLVAFESGVPAIFSFTKIFVSYRRRLRLDLVERRPCCIGRPCGTIPAAAIELL